MPFFKWIFLHFGHHKQKKDILVPLYWREVNMYMGRTVPKYCSVHTNSTTCSHTHTHTLCLQWRLGRVKPFAACCPETYMRVRETRKGAKLKMTVSWWVVSGVLVGWPNHYKSLMLLSTAPVATPFSQPACATQHLFCPQSSKNVMRSLINTT